MTHGTETDFKANLADLTKIPPIEFEKHFHEWMERDDVARGLQAKLRCDLIKNFNKTNLGKHIISHTTMSSSGGSTMRLSLSPLILALNTLVAEFLYAQNCHFTLSVFCTEIPFRNTLPDFESMRYFRFNKIEIAEIWEAVTGSVANKTELNKYIIKNYESNPNVSLLLLIVKCLLEQRPSELLQKSVEIQTETPYKSHRSTSVQAVEEKGKSPSKSPSKSPNKDDNLHHINEYLLTLAEKVKEMTKEFEQLAKQQNLPRPIRSFRSSRSREYYAINKSLEHITSNMKQISLAKRKNKRLSNIVDSIDNLTKQFGKCAQNFDNVTKVLSSKKEQKSPVEMQKSRVKVSYKEKQTETEKQEKSYADWIHEMRTTTNGKKFLDRVEISLHKALSKHREQLQNETDIKMKHLKSLLKLHYQQKLTKHLMQQEPKETFEENRKLNENIELKLQQFEIKQMELMQQLRESSFELQEAQRKQKEKRIEREEELQTKEHTKKASDIKWMAQPESPTQFQLKGSGDGQIPPLKEHISNQNPNENVAATKVHQKERLQTLNENRLLKDTQKQLQDMVSTISEQGRTVDHIIYDAKLRMQQLENESNQLEQNFQSYLERRKREQLLEQQTLKQNFEKLLNQPKDKLQTIIIDREKIKNSELVFHNSAESKSTLQELQTKSLREDEEIENEEFKRMKEKLYESQKEFENPISAKSDSTTSLEFRNSILEAKLKFFENESTLRKSKEQELDTRTGNLLQKELVKYPEIFEPSYYNKKFGQQESETNVNFCMATENKDKREFNMASSIYEINIKDKLLDEEQEINKLSYMTEQTSHKSPENKIPTSARRELFPKETFIHEEELKLQLKSPEINTNNTLTPLAMELTQKVRFYEPISIDTKDLRQALKGLRHYAETMENKPVQGTTTTSQLIKQSMAKMQQLFEQKQPKETITEMIQGIEQKERENMRKDSKLEGELKISELNTTTTSTTVTSNQTTTTATTNTTTNEELLMKTQDEMFKNVANLNRISNTSMPSILNLTSEESDESINEEMKITRETSKETRKDISENQKDQKPKVAVNEYVLDESYESSEYNLLPIQVGNKPQVIQQLEIGQDKDFSTHSVLDVSPTGNDMEIGELLSESSPKFTPIDVKLSDSSSQTSIDLEISTGKRRKSKTKVHSDDSENDFWA